MKHLTIFDVLQYGPIVAQDEDSGLIVTVNGSYFNAYTSLGDGTFSTVEWCRPLSSYIQSQGLYGADMAKVLLIAETLLKSELLNTEDEALND